MLAVLSVVINPGATRFPLIPLDDTSFERDFVNPIRPENEYYSQNTSSCRARGNFPYI